MPEMKPCPFCGGEATLDQHKTRAFCRNAGCPKDAAPLAVWNTRATDVMLEKALDALETARHLIDHGDFRNGNTDPTGSMDEGAVLAGSVIGELDDFLVSVSRYRWANAEHTAIERV